MRRPSFPVISMSFVIASVFVAGLFFSGCSSCTEETKRTVVPPKVEEKVDLSGTLAARIPANSYGFVKWDGKHPAYEKLLNSPWAGSGSLMSVMESSDSEIGKITSVLSRVGLDPTDRETWRKVFSEAVFFFAPGSQSDQAGVSGPPAIGVVFRSDKIELAGKLKEIRGQLGGTEFEVADVSIAGAEGFSFVSKTETGQSGVPAKIFLVSKDDLGVLASDQAVIEGVLNSKGESLPVLVQSDQFKRSVSGFPGKDKRFALAYFDLARLVADAQARGGPDKSKDIPFEAVSFALGMDKSPETDIRLVFDPAKSGENSWFNALAVSRSDKIASAVPGKPLAFLSIDGQTVSKIKQLASAEAQNVQTPWLDQLAFLDSAKRIGLVARLAPIGQSILPLPDLLLVFDTSNSEQTAAQIEKLVMSLMQGNPTMAGMQWVEKDVGGGKKVKSMMSPLGVGVFLATKGDLVLVASTENQLKALFSDSSKGVFGGSLSAQAETVLSADSTIGNIYLNFEEVGSFLQNMGGLLSMYAPQSKEAGELLQPENIDSIKKMGTMIGSVTLDQGIIGFRSFYEAKAA